MRAGAQVNAAFPVGKPTVVAIAGVSLFVIVLGLRDRHLLLLVPLGLIFLGFAATLYWMDVRRPTPQERLRRLRETAGGVEIVLRQQHPATRIGLAWLMAAFFAWMAFVVRDDPGPASSLLMAIAALWLLPVPDAVRALTRRPRLLITQRGIDVRGWSEDHRVDWDDVNHAGAVGVGMRADHVLVGLKPHAPSYRKRRRHLLVPLEMIGMRRVPGGGFRLQSNGFDSPAAVGVLLGRLPFFPEAQRGRVIDTWLHYVRQYDENTAAREFDIAVKNLLFRL